MGQGLHQMKVGVEGVGSESRGEGGARQVGGFGVAGIRVGCSHH